MVDRFAQVGYNNSIWHREVNAHGLSTDAQADSGSILFFRQ